MKSRRNYLAASFFLLVTATAHAQTNPVPFVNQPLVPAAAVPGGPAFTLTVNGTGFVPGSVVNWDGSARATNFVSVGKLTATILASDIATAATASVTVFNPAPGVGTSNVAFFQVTNSTPSVSLMRFDSSLPTTAGASSVVADDFNKDSHIDLAVPIVLAGIGNAIAILLGHGDGTFSEHDSSLPPCGTVSGCGITSLAAGDFNGDGNLDLAVTQAGDNTVTVLLGTGSGDFRVAAQYVVGNDPVSVAVGDFNGDGKLDLAVATAVSGAVDILLGNGDGTFQPPVGYGARGPFGAGPFDVAVGDFNADGKLDLVVAIPADSTVSILLGNGDGTFQPEVFYPTPWVPGPSVWLTSTVMANWTSSPSTGTQFPFCWATGMGRSSLTSNTRLALVHFRP